MLSLSHMPHTHTYTQCRVCYGRTQNCRRKYSPWPGHSIKVGDINRVKVHDGIINPSLQPDTVNLVKSARDYTPERVGQFLEGVGLGHHRNAFCDAEISGDVLLDAAEEMLEELGVTSATERLKIKVH